MTRRLLADPVRVAILGTLAVGLAILITLNLSRIPFVHPTSAYTADLANTGGLITGDEVKVSGVPVGTVTDLRVVGGHVEASFTVDRNVKLGARSAASVEIATVLGAVFLQITSSGSGTLQPGAHIPVARTVVPFTLVEAFQAAGTTVAGTDLGQLRRSLGQLNAALGQVSGADVRATLEGLTTISTAMASRAGEIRTLLSSAQQVTDLLNTKSATIVQLLGNTDTFLAVLDQRRDVITQILKDTSSLGADLGALIDQNQHQLAPAFADLTRVAQVLLGKKRDLERSIQLLGQFTGNIDSATNSGSWLDLFLPTSVTPDNVIARCGVSPKPGCGN